MRKDVCAFFVSIGILGISALCAESVAKPQVVVSQRSLEAGDLSADDLSIAAKLSDQHRKMFTEKLTSEQRRQVAVAIDNGTSPDEAVQRLIEARERIQSAIVSNEEIAEGSEESVQ